MWESAKQSPTKIFSLPHGQKPYAREGRAAHDGPRSTGGELCAGEVEGKESDKSWALVTAGSSLPLGQEFQGKGVRRRKLAHEHSFK